MRQRITYLMPQGSGVDPADIQVDTTGLTYSKVHEAGEERRITLGLSELPQELQLFLDDFHELHVRIASQQQYDAFIPSVSRMPPGLHVFFTPRKPDGRTTICSSLKNFLGEQVQCSDSRDSFSRPPILSERFATASTYHFYQDLSFLSHLQHHLDTKLCAIVAETTSLAALCTAVSQSATPAYIDLDFDVISHTLTLILFWSPTLGTDGSSRPLAGKLDPEDRLEVGVLSPEISSEPEELSLGGYLTVIGEDERPSPTLFSFPARHHPLPASDKTTYTIHFNTPTGLHPTLNITFHTTPQPPRLKSTCALHAYFTLPSHLFIDSYQLSDPLLLSSHNLIALRSLSGAQDLEAPDWAIKTWGSAALFELDPSSATASVTIPTHLRYINSTSETSVTIPWPVVFWACEAEGGPKMATNPFDRVNLGYDGLFGSQTMFYHVPPRDGAELVEILTPPTLKGEWNEWVSVGTTVAVLLGFAWVCWQLLSGLMSETRRTEEEQKKNKKAQ